MLGEAQDLSPFDAHKALLAFASRRGESALRLAMHAALPQALRPELLHLLRLNFVPESLREPAVEADVLFAPFCEDSGNGYYRFAPNARFQLLRGLDDAYSGQNVPRSRQVARFLAAYVDQQSRHSSRSADHLYVQYLELERWNALGFMDPTAAASQLAAAMQRAMEPGNVAARLRITGLATALSTPLARYSALVSYAAGLEALQNGDTERAVDILEPIGDTELEFGGIRLTPVHAVLSARVRTASKAANEPAPMVEPGPKEASAGLQGKSQEPSPSDTEGKRYIFISASHRDREWVDRVRQNLRSLEGSHGIHVWVDWPGADEDSVSWMLDRVVSQVDVAIVLVSPSYLASENLRSRELPRLIERADKHELQLTWVVIEDCSWMSTPLVKFQSVYDPNRPLTNLRPSLRAEAMLEIARGIERIVAKDRSEPLEDRSKSPDSSPLKDRIYFSYRRKDAEGYAGRLADSLEAVFGDTLFFDRASIDFGSEFPFVLQREAADCRVMLVVITPTWARDLAPRSQNPEEKDWVLEEVSIALGRPERVVIPVLVGDATMPSAWDLPHRIRELANYNAIDLRSRDWKADVERLVEHLKASITVSRSRQASGTTQVQVMFIGHSVDRPDRSKPRFPPSAEQAVRAAIRETLERIKASEGSLAGIASGSDGGDIIFHEVCAELGIPSTLFLPTHAEEFGQRYLRTAGRFWTSRFFEVAKRVKVEILESPGVAAGSGDAPVGFAGDEWERNAEKMFERVTEHGPERAMLLALWDGRWGQAGGPAYVVDKAKALGIRVEVIDLQELRGSHATTASGSASGEKSAEWYDVETKFDLAKAYLGMNDKDGAMDILRAILRAGDPEQQARATQQLGELVRTSDDHKPSADRSMSEHRPRISGSSGVESAGTVTRGRSKRRRMKKK